MKMSFNQTDIVEKPKIQLKAVFSRSRIKEISGKIYGLKTLKTHRKFRRSKIYFLLSVTLNVDIKEQNNIYI